MIRTEKQLTATKANVANFEKALQELRLKKSTMDPDRFDLDESGLLSMLGALKEEISEYEALSNDNCKSQVFGGEIDDFPIMLIKARLVCKLSQSDLAKKIDVEPQQIQRYEANGYDGVSFGRLLDIRDAIGLETTCTGIIITNAMFDTGDDNDAKAEKLEEELSNSTKSLMGA